MTARERAMERLNRLMSQWTIAGAQQEIVRSQKSIEYYNNLPVWKRNAYDIKLELKRFASEIEILTAIVEILTEQAEVEVAAEAVQAVNSFSKATVTHKVIAMVANKLRKLGYSLSDCFKRAWMLVKGAVGFMYGNWVAVA